MTPAELNEKCICLEYVCCSLCSTLSCDCDKDKHAKIRANNEKCGAHPKPTFEDYSRGIIISL